MSYGLMLAVGVAAVFLGVTMAVLAMGGHVSERRQVGRSLQALRAQGVSTSVRPELDRPFTERVVDPFLRSLTRVGRVLAGADKAERIRRALDLAGNPAGWDTDRVVATKIVGLVSGAVTGALVPLLLRLGVPVILGATVVVGFAGYLLPNFILVNTRQRRTQQMRVTLPDAIDLLTISVESGLGFDAALAQVARNTTGPVAEELFRVLQEMQIGMGRTDAIRALGDRTDLPELKSFVTAMVQADAFGIPIANVLRTQSKEMRVKRRQNAEEMAQKVPVKILFPLIFFILPALFVVILGPAVISILKIF